MLVGFGTNDDLNLLVDVGGVTRGGGPYHRTLLVTQLIADHKKTRNIERGALMKKGSEQPHSRKMDDVHCLANLGTGRAGCRDAGV